MIWIYSVLVFAADQPLKSNIPEKERTFLTGLHDSFERRQDQRNPLYLKYRVQEFESAAHLKRLASPPAPPGQQTKEAQDLPQFEDVQYTVEAEIAKKGKRYRTSHKGPIISKGKLVQTENPFVHVFDGEKTIRSDNFPGNVYEVSSDPAASKGYADPWTMCGETNLLHVLQDWQNDKKPNITEVKSMETVSPNKEHLVILELSYDTGWRNKVWLLPDIDYSIQRFEVYDNKNRLLTKSDECTYKMIDGVPYPVSGKQVIYFTNGDRARESRFETVEIETSAAKIPDQLFMLDVPVDAKVFDRDSQTYYSSDSKENETHLAFKRFAALILLLIVIAGSLVYIFVRKRVRSIRA